MQSHALFVAGVGERFDDVLFVRRVHDVVVRLLRVPHRKTVVVSCREADIFDTSVLERLNPAVGVKVVWIKRVGNLLIFLSVEFASFQIPFPLCEEAVDAPVQKDTESAVGKFLASLQVLGAWRVGGRRLLRRRGGSEEQCRNQRKASSFQKIRDFSHVFLCDGC